MAGWCVRPGSNRTPPVWKTGTQPTTPRPQEWRRRNGRGRRRCSVRPAPSVLQDLIDRDGITDPVRVMAVSTGIEPVRPEGLDALAPRCLTARPTLHSNGALGWTRTSIGPFRRRLTVRLVHERACWKPRPVLPRLMAVLQTAAFLFRHGAKLSARTDDWPSRQELEPAYLRVRSALLIQLSYGKMKLAPAARFERAFLR